MIKKIFIIFTFVLIIFNISKVQATSELINSEEKQSKLTSEENINKRETSVSRNVRKATLGIQISDMLEAEGVKNVKISVENEDKTFYKEYISDESGVIYVQNLEVGTLKIKVLEIPEDYICEETEYIKEIESDEDTYYVQHIKLRHKMGNLLIKCNKKGIQFNISNEWWFGGFATNEKGEIYVRDINTGKCLITQSSSGEEIITEPIEVMIEADKTCEVIIGNETTEKDEENEGEKTDDKVGDSAQDEKKEDDKQEDKKPEVGAETGEKTDDKVGDNTQDEKKEDDKQEDNKQEDDKKFPDAEAGNKKEESNDKNSKDEKDNSKNSEQNSIKNDEKKKTQNSDEKILTTDDKQNNLIIKNEKEKTKSQQTREDIISTDAPVRLPKTGDDYFKIKVILFNSLIFIVSTIIACIAKKKTDQR